MKNVLLPLDEAVPPGGREAFGDHQGQGRIGVWGAIFRLHMGSDSRGHAALKGLGEGGC